MKDSDLSQSYLVLGHKGFLGQNICQSLMENGNKVVIIPERLNTENLENIAAKYFNRGAVIINCIASGVTPRLDQRTSYHFTNTMLPEILLKLFVKSDGHYFIHFGSHYETNKDHVILDRLNYIESKALGSQVCKFYSQTDKRVKLLYLPTILNYNQPTGRFFIDFINSSINNSFFQISHPNSIIKVSSYDSFFQHLNKLLIFQGNASSFLPPEAVMSVLDFSNFLNTLLIKNALHPVRICTKNSHQIHISEREVDKGFAHKIEKMILKIYERIK